MKAISLWQPWATLVAVGAKQFETRNWATRHRGAIAIHAAARKPTREILEMMEGPYFREALGRPALTPTLSHGERGALPMGAIVAVAELVDCVPVETIRDSLSEAERAFGDFRDGRFAWKLENVRAIVPAVKWKGMQGLFEIAWTAGGKVKTASSRARL